MENSVLIIIDGYNLLRSIFYREKGKLDKERKQLVKILGRYKRLKNIDIMIVFDGGDGLYAYREVRNGVVVVFSGHKKNADDWIYEYIKHHRPAFTLLISKDKELIERTSKFDVDSINPDDFYDIVNYRLLESDKKNLEDKGCCRDIKKLKLSDKVMVDREGVDEEELDRLMLQADVDSFFNEDEESVEVNCRKRKSKVLSKRERALLKKLKKL